MEVRIGSSRLDPHVMTPPGKKTPVALEACECTECNANRDAVKQAQDSSLPRSGIYYDISRKMTSRRNCYPLVGGSTKTRVEGTVVRLTGLRENTKTSYR